MFAQAEAGIFLIIDNTEDVGLNDFHPKIISVNPYDGAELHLSAHNGHPVVVSLGEKHANTNNITVRLIEMILVQSGSFQMGQNGDGTSGNVTPVHTVTLTQNYYMGKYEVTQEQYMAVMRNNPSSYHGGTGREPAIGEIQGKRPVEMVSWYDAIVFCNRLSILEGLTPTYSISGSTDTEAWGDVPTGSNAAWNAVIIVAGSAGYRLPTEAQWEYAAKGGHLSQGYIYAGSNNAGEVGWYADNCGGKTHEVGFKKPNELGLYDMSGNVYEWCWDWYGAYTADAKTDPTGAVTGTYRVLRGGSWMRSVTSVLSVSPKTDYPNTKDKYHGFRVVRL